MCAHTMTSAKCVCVCVRIPPYSYSQSLGGACTGTYDLRLQTFRLEDVEEGVAG